MDINKQIKNFISYLSGSFLLVFIGLLTTPFITRVLEPNEFGKFSIFEMVTNALYMITLLGTDHAFMRFYYERKNKKELLVQSLIFPISIMLIIIFVFIKFGNSLSYLLFKENNGVILYIIALQTLILIFNRYALIVVRFLTNSGKIFSALQIIQKLSYILMIFILNQYISNYRLLVYSFTLSYLISTLVTILYKKEEWDILLKIPKVKVKEMKEITIYGFPFFITVIFSFIFRYCDKIILNILTNFTQLGLYTSSMSIISILNSIHTAFTAYWTPTALKKYQDSPDEKDFFILINNVITGVMFFLGISILFLKDIIIYLLGSKYRESLYIIPFLIFLPICNVLGETTSIGISFKKKPKYFLYIMIISSICNIVGNILLIPIWGAKGAAIASAISYIIMFIMKTVQSSKLYKINFLYKRLFILFFITSIYAMSSTFLISSWVNYLLGMICYIILMFSYRNEIYQLFTYIKSLNEKNKIV